MERQDAESYARQPQDLEEAPYRRAFRTGVIPMKRGEVGWVSFEHPGKRRPAVILTRNSAIGYLSTVTVAPITTTIRPTPSMAPLGFLIIMV
jgi:hypothetical protein